MQNVLVTGASGFIGQHLVALLQQRGINVVTNLAWQDEALASSLAQAQVTHVVHLAGMAHAQVAGAALSQLHQVNAVDTTALFTACQQAKVASFVWLSSIKVLGEFAEQPLTIDTRPAPVGPYAQSKAAGERLLEAAHAVQPATQLVIIRPPLVYGAGVGANFYQLLRWAARGWPLPLAGAQALRSMVGVGNLVDLIVRGLSAPSGTYHVSDDDDWSVAQLLRYCAQQMNVPSRLFTIPAPVLTGVAALVGRSDAAARLLLPLRVDCQSTQSRLDWQPPHTVQQQLGEAVQWYLKQG